MSSPDHAELLAKAIACLEGGLIDLRTAGQTNGAVQRPTRTRRRIGPTRPGRKKRPSARNDGQGRQWHRFARAEGSLAGRDTGLPICASGGRDTGLKASSREAREDVLLMLETSMAIFSNTCFFPLLQFALLMLLLFAIWRDYRPAPRSRSVGLLSTISVGMSQITTGVNATIRRSLEVMNMFDKFIGLFFAAIITVLNKSVFDDNEVHWRHYSAAINTFDLIAIIYLCYVSPWGRNHIFGFNQREEQR